MTHSSHSLHQEPLAIIGIGCRLPSGLNDPESFWRFLCDARVAAGEIPPDRWNPLTFYDPDADKPGTMNMRRGGFLDHIDQMDAEFFGISPREAPGIDPQHRLLLETAWEALEDAGEVAERLAGTQTGVFIGISRSDYEGVTIHDVDLIHAYTNSGVALSLAANRVSYVFDFRGPSMAVDTACASALTAVHLACQSLRQDECSLAIAGGASVLIRPHFSIGYTKAHMLAADGRCKTFDARADGFGRAEGVGVVVLKRLRDALADGNPIYAVVRGSGINTDGHKSGIMLPSADAQAALLRDVYRRAGVPVDRVGYVEAHGTGTPVGDPIEVEALGQALGAGRRPGNVCLLGSAKANVGHLSSAAGIVGLIKAALCLRHRLVPPQPLLERLNPQIPFDRLPFRVPVQLEPFPAGPGPAIAGVSAFGFGGANAHVVLEEAPSEVPAEPRAAGTTDRERTSLVPASVPSSSGPYLLPLSARSAEALRAFAQACRDLIGTLPAPAELEDLAYSLGVRRSHHDYRLALTAHSCDEAQELLDTFLAGQEHAGLVVGRRVPSERTKIAFVCSGMGPQWWGMGRQLLADEPAFKDAVARCEAAIRREAGWSLLEALTAGEASSRLDDSSVAQPAMFGIQIALAALWRSWGLVPDAVVGHSTGEVAAAHLAGALSLEDAVRVICHRSRLQQRTAGIGGMLAVGLSPEEAGREATQWPGRVSVAALNSPHAATLSGETRALEQIAASCEAKGIFCRFLKIPSPAHSHYLDPLRGELEDVLQSLRPRTASLPLFSTVTGQRAGGEELGNSYWWRNMRQPVRFAEAMRTMIDEGYRLFVEVSPHPVLAGSIAECLAAAGQEGAALPSLRRHDEEKAVMWGTLGALYARGHPVQWNRLYRGGRFVRFPRYPWQRRRFWLESDASRRERLGQDDHPLLGRRQNTARPSWETKTDPRRLPLVADHRVQGTAVYPGAGYVEMGLAAARALFETPPYTLEGLEIRQPMAFPEGGAARAVQSLYTPADGSFEIYSRAAGGESPWILHAALRLPPPVGRDDVPPPLPLDPIRSRCRSEIPIDAFLSEKERAGQTLGPRFRTVRQLWVGAEEALARIEAPEPVQAEWHAYLLHPALVDACVQLMPAIVIGQHERDMDGLYLPIRIRRARLFGRAASPLWAYARMVKRDGRARTADLVLCDEAGNVVLALDGVESRYLEGTGRRDQHADWLYEPRWRLEPRPGDAPGQTAHELPAPSQLAAHVRGAAASPAVGADAEYDGFESGLDRLAGAYVVRAFAQLGWPWRTGDDISLAQAAEALGVPPRRERLLARCLSVLDEDGLLDRRGDDRWIVQRVPAGEDGASLQRAWQTLLREWPAGYAELGLLRSTGDRLARVLRDEIDPEQLLVPDGDFATVEWYYQDSPTYRNSNERVRRIVDGVLDSLPSWGALRILEAGGGLGGTAAHVLPGVPAGRAQYVLSDVSPSLLAHAEQRFADYPFVEYRRLDLAHDPAGQGFTPHAFDLVLLSSFRCVADGLLPTVRRLGALLASGGLLVLADPRLGRTRRWSDVAFGALPGYWPCRDSGSAAGIRQVLAQAGFADVEVVAGTGQDGRPAAIVARGPLEAPSPPAVPAELPREARTWLIFADRQNIAARVAQWLRQRGASCVLVDHAEAFARPAADRFEVRPGCAEDMRRVLDALGTGQAASGQVLHLWSLDIPSSDTLSSAALAQSQALGVVSVLHLVQALDGARWTPRLWLATGGSQLETRAVGQSPLWGLGRVIQNEHPEFQCMLVDMSAERDGADVEALCAELVSATAEREIALRGRARWVPRLDRLPAGRLRTVRRPHRDGFRAALPARGTLENVRLETAPRRAPGTAEVEIEVFAAALNFKDVLTALAVIPAERMLLGLECAGRISAVGDGVERFRVGDHVMALAPGCLGAFITTPAALVVRKPAGVSFADAATLPVAFVTACYGLEHLGRLARGERVLIHAATGGVGLAAIQIARRLGAEVFATAGSPEKREFLRRLGVEHVMDSRSLEFADEVMRRTRGEGVDVILNSLAGEAIERGLAVLRPGGRFVDISKTDILAGHRVGLRVFEKNLSYAALDVSQLRAERPALVGAILDEMVRRVEAGAIGPLPHRVFPIAHTAEAFRHFAKTRHIGKIVIDVKAEEAPRVWVAPEELFRADATYLITGGLGGFGLVTAEWMAARGARHLALVGRRGAASAASQAAVRRLRHAGVTVEVFRADVTREGELADLLGEIGRSLPPLRGVVHAAMVLDDGALLRMDADRFMSVLAPKMLGAWNLHRLTAQAPLDLYLLYSSVAVVHGHPVQGNYAAANAFLTALAWHRRAAGRAATAVDWGAIADVGYLAEHDEVGRAVERAAVVAPVPAVDALAALETALPGAPAEIGIFPHDWAQFRRGYPIATSPRFAEFAGDGRTAPDAAAADRASLLSQLSAAAPERRHTLIESHLRARISKIMGLSGAKLDAAQPLVMLGLDSLMAIELRTWIQGELGRDIPIMMLLGGATLAQLATELTRDARVEQSESAANRPLELEEIRL
ncbi:MAG TPA: SDR family NAD(P)-dependent oxidoreductase [bacterium]|nr:SDR family NAD(P)-dependent oxidoreductase [bacterium]